MQTTTTTSGRKTSFTDSDREAIDRIADHPAMLLERFATASHRFLNYKRVNIQRLSEEGAQMDYIAEVILAHGAAKAEYEYLFALCSARIGAGLRA